MKVVGGMPGAAHACECFVQLTRLGGATRYETAFAVVNDAFRGDDDIPELSEAVFLASGANYPDALAAGPAAAPREVVLATKASMRATAIPGFTDAEHHEAAKNIELGPQAKTVESPEFRARLAAAKRR